MTTVLCLGDSNTHGTAPMADAAARDRFGAKERWPGVMAAALGDGVLMVEEGLPGRTTVHPDPVSGPLMDGLTILPALLHSHRPVDLVVVMLGTNDLKARFALTAFDIAEGCRRLLQTIRCSEAGPDRGADRGAPKALLVCPPPIAETGWLAETFAGGARKSRGLAAHMERVARESGAAFLDAGGLIAPDPLDGIHFCAESHGTLGRAIADAVGRALQDQ
jgi:lysophospholipase L1-like esterase